MSCSLRFPADVTDAPPLMWGAMQSGQVFGEGEYEIVSSAPIGKGSGGTVYRGSRRATNTPVAVKCIDRLEVDCDPQKVQQLEREMNIAIKLRHQNIVNLLDVKFEEEVRAYSKKALVRLRLILQPSEPGTPCLEQVVLMVSELVDGGPLYDRVAAGPIPEEEARYYFHQMCAGVEYCHGQSVIHRDLKLENILVSRIGTRARTLIPTRFVHRTELTVLVPLRRA